MKLLSTLCTAGVALLASNAQAQTTTGTCVTLSTMSVCKNWGGYSVPATADYSDAASFEAYILNQFDSNPAGQAAFRNQYGCPTYAGAGRRYHISVLCGSIIASATSGANSCNPGTAPPIPLCKATADAAIASLNKIFADNSVCPAGQARTLDAATQAYASSLTSSVNCIPALDDEWAMCGFAAEADASKYCSDASTKADACCTAHQAKLAGQPISVPNGVTVVDPITTAGAPTTDAPSSGSSKPAVSTPIIIAIAGGAVGLILICLLVVFLVKRSHKKRKAPTGFSATQSNFSNHSTPTLTRGLSSRQNTASSKTNLLQRNASERSLPMRQNTFNGEQGTLGAAAMMGVAAPREDVGEPIQIAETMEVVYNYVPNLADEIYLYIGDPVIVKCKFDDGWGYGFNMTTKQEGSFPLACVDTYGTAKKPRANNDGAQQISPHPHDQWAADSDTYDSYSRRPRSTSLARPIAALDPDNFSRNPSQSRRKPSVRQPQASTYEAYTAPVIGRKPSVRSPLPYTPAYNSPVERKPSLRHQQNSYQGYSANILDYDDDTTAPSLPSLTRNNTHNIRPNGAGYNYNSYTTHDTMTSGTMRSDASGETWGVGAGSAASSGGAGPSSALSPPPPPLGSVDLEKFKVRTVRQTYAPPPHEYFHDTRRK